MRFSAYAMVFLCFLTTLNIAARNKVIYGDDNREDINNSNNDFYQELAKSTAIMVHRNKFSFSRSEENYKLQGRTLEQNGMCSEERFSQQLAVGNCSGFLVGEDLLVTAGHCIKDMDDCQDYYWAFDFVADNQNQSGRSLFGKDEVYKCKEIIERSLGRGTSDDYALIRLGRVVKDRSPLEFRKSGKISEGESIFVIGNPSGLPTKVANGAYVRSNEKQEFFVTNLDTYGGNSGSAVFNSHGTVEGILVRGEQDFVMESSRRCLLSNYCTDDGCRGEDVTRITNIKYLQSL